MKSDIDSITEYVAIQLSENGFVTIDNLLDKTALIALKNRFIELQQEDEFEKAGIGKQLNYAVDKNVRGDFIRWIDEKDSKAVTNPLLEVVKELIYKLNRNCFLGIRDIELHYAYYPKGKGYQMHRDRFKNNPHRLISFVFYLNENWLKGDGGELVLYNEEIKETAMIQPIENRLAIFLSETLHEVLPCSKERKSITGWMLDTPKELSFIVN